jgi:HK97 family phage portal protein
MFGYIRKTKAVDYFINTLQQFTYNNTLQLQQRSNVVYGYGNQTEQITAYATLDDLYSITRKIAKTCKRIPLYVYEVRDEKAFGRYRILQRRNKYDNKHIYDLKDLQTKAMEIIGEQDPLQKLIDNPNPEQGKDEYYELAYLFPLLTGNEYEWMNVVDNGSNAGKPYALYHLPPDQVYPLASESIPRKVMGYEWRLGQLISFDPDQIIHRRYANPIYDYTGNELVGLSPLKAASKTLTQIGNERDYANNSLLNAGAEGFINNEDADFNPETWGSVKSDIMTELGAVRDRSGNNLNAKKLGLLLGKWKYNQIGISPGDMQLIEQGKTTFKKLCNIYGISDILFNNDSAATESNVKQMIREMYTNVVLPEVSSKVSSYNRSLTPLYQQDTRKKTIDYDVTDIVELQEDMTEVAQRFASAPAFRVNDLYEAMGWGRLDDPNAEVVLIKSGYTPLEDIIQTIDIPNDYPAT